MKKEKISYSLRTLYFSEMVGRLTIQDVLVYHLLISISFGNAIQSRIKTVILHDLGLLNCFPD